MAAGADPGAAARYRLMLENGVRTALARNGDANEERRSHRAGLITTSVIGINLVSKVTGDSNEIARLIDALTDLVSGWIHETDLSPSS